MIRLLDYIKAIQENQVVNFGGARSDYGQCIILAGGPGSGKGYVKDTKVLASFKSIDVDELKKKYIKMQEKGLIDDTKKYDLRNPDDTSALHQKVKSHGWKNKQRKNFWNQRKTDSSILPNILWDMVSDNPEDILEVIKYAKPVGYQVTLIWVCCNIETAKEGNEKRDRRVSLEVLEKGHKYAYKCLTNILQNKEPDLTKNIDNFWIVFTPGYKRKLTKKYEDNPCVKIKRDKEGNFIYNEKEEVDNFLKEQMPIDLDWDEKQEAEKKRKEKLKSTLTKEILNN